MTLTLVAPAGSSPHLGFDLGLEHTGVAWPGGTGVYDCPNRYRKDRTLRLRWWASRFDTELAPYRDVDDVICVVEAPFIHPKHPTGAIPTIELHGVFRLRAGNIGASVVTVDNKKLKLYATGKGNASKDEMLAAARRRGLETDSYDEADAFLVWHWWEDRAYIRGTSPGLLTDNGRRVRLGAA